MGRPAILLVDDEQANLGTFARLFRKELDVKVAASGVAAIEILERHPIDVLITDYAMPGMNGLELLEIAAPRWPAVHRVVTSGHSDLPELLEAARTGLASELLPKPWHKPDLLAVIARVMARSGAAVAVRPTGSSG
jgi:CheY-like chemotaxis protein